MKTKPAWAEAFDLKRSEKSRAVLDALQAGTQEEIRLRAAMMASVDEGVGMIFEALERSGRLDDTFILFLGDNGYFFGEHGLGPERRFAYEEGIRSPFIARYPKRIKAGTRIRRAIVDRFNVLGPRAAIGYDAEKDAHQYYVDPSGIVVLPRGQTRV